jgi:hypothetical protein
MNMLRMDGGPQEDPAAAAYWRERARQDAIFVARNMREWDAKEIYATRWDDDPVEVVDLCLTLAAGFSWVAGKDEPIAVIGAWPRYNGVWSVYMFGTDRFPEIGLGMTRFVRQAMIPALVEAGIHRADCQSIEGHTDAHRWLKKQGLHQEGPLLEGFGRNGENFLQFVWLRKNYVPRRFQPPSR